MTKRLTLLMIAALFACSASASCQMQHSKLNALEKLQPTDNPEQDADELVMKTCEVWNDVLGVDESLIDPDYYAKTKLATKKKLEEFCNHHKDTDFQELYGKACSKYCINSPERDAQLERVRLLYNYHVGFKHHR